MPGIRANVYVDGFNLYYGCLKGTSYRWLNLGKLCALVFPRYQIQRIRYFTARISPSPQDPQKPLRQQLLIRALETVPNLSMHYGNFLSHRVRMPLAQPAPGGPATVEVVKTEEKGSDVNLATYLITDGFLADYDIAVVVSNDSDLIEPIRVVQSKLKLPVCVLNPQSDPRKTSWSLMKTATSYRRIRKGVLLASQFPPTLQDANGAFTKPATW